MASDAGSLRTAWPDIGRSNANSAHKQASAPPTCCVRVCKTPKGQRPSALGLVIVECNFGVLAILKINCQDHPVVPLGPQYGRLQRHGTISY
jgi:hypothetical protein